MHTSLAEFHDEATAEYESAFDWYLERGPDAAIGFDAEVDHALAQIIAAPRRWAAGPHSTRRFLLRKFPFTLIYRERASGGHSDSRGCAHQPEAGILEGAALIFNHSRNREIQLLVTERRAEFLESWNEFFGIGG